jgi:hypothetical protein
MSTLLASAFKGSLPKIFIGGRRARRTWTNGRAGFRILTPGWDGSCPRIRALSQVFSCSVCCMAFSGAEVACFVLYREGMPLFAHLTPAHTPTASWTSVFTIPSQQPSLALTKVRVQVLSALGPLFAVPSPVAAPASCGTRKRTDDYPVLGDAPDKRAP